MSWPSSSPCPTPARRSGTASAATTSSSCCTTATAACRASSRSQPHSRAGGSGWRCRICMTGCARPTERRHPGSCTISTSRPRSASWTRPSWMPGPTTRVPGSASSASRWVDGSHSSTRRPARRMPSSPTTRRCTRTSTASSPRPCCCTGRRSDEWREGEDPESFVDRLKEHGTPTSQHTYLGTVHTFANASFRAKLNAQAAALAFARTAVFLEGHLHD